MRFFLICCFSLWCIASHAAPPTPALRLLLTAPEVTLDPALASDLSSLSLVENLFEPPLRYHYLARPVTLEGNTASALPSVSDGGKTYLLHIKPGIFFRPDPAFKGVARELTASDYVYSWQRLYDPTLKSPWAYLLQGKLLGDEALQAAGKFDVKTAIAGLQALDKYTLQIRLKQADPNFLYFLAMPVSSAIAPEVVQSYGAQVGSHPVGTGPYLLQEWQRGHHLVLEAMPGYRADTLSAHKAIAQDDITLSRALAGKTLPRTKRLEIAVVEEPQAYLLAFLDGQFDYLEQVPPTMAGMVLQGGAGPALALKPALASKGMKLSPFTPLQTYYLWMNMQDPLLGGYSVDKIALRRAIALAYNREEDINLLEKGLALPAQMPIPPLALGYDAGYRSSNRYDLALANRLLDKFGYGKRDAQGFRLQASGAPLVLRMHAVTTSDGRVRAEAWRKCLLALGIQLEFVFDKKSEINKAARLGKVQMFETNWIGDYPDGENFLQLLYGPNSGRANYAHFQLPAYDKLYEQARDLPPGAARDALYKQMAQLIDAYNPWVLRIYPLSLDLQQPWLKQYRRHPVALTNWRYLESERK
ncbi:MAG: heme-binding protein [Burkholderiales bacterium]|nr:heme-binding protein [Burkholderiales bacterium]